MSAIHKTTETKKQEPLTKEETPAKPTSVTATGRTALITTVIAIALNPISLVAGYFINHLLQAPKLTIENVIPSYTVFPKKLGPEGVKALESSPRMSSAIRNIVAQRVPVGSQQPVCTLWLDGQDWDDSCEDQVRDSIGGLRQTLILEKQSLTNNIQIIEHWQPPAKLVLEPLNTPDSNVMRLMQSIQGRQFDREQALAQFKYYLNQDTIGLSALERLKKAFEYMLKAPDSVTEDLAFDIGVLNSGDSDGVIFDSGNVSFGTTKLSLHSENYNVVKAHSFESVHFRMFYGQVGPDQKKIQHLVKTQDKEVPFHVSILVGKTNIEADGVLPTKSD